MISVILILIVIICVYKSSHVFRYYFKNFGLLVMVTQFVILIILPYLAIHGRTSFNAVLASRCVRWITLLVGVRWTVKHVERLNEQSCCIVLSNHQHTLDIMGMFQIWPDRLTVVAKNSIRYMGSFGLGGWLSNLVFIHRGQGSRTRKEMDDAMRELIKSDTKLWIFPEGTRRNTNEIHAFKKGAFELAVKHQVPLQPLVYSSYRHFIDPVRKTFGEGEAMMTVMPRISTVGLTMDDVPELMDRTKKMMEDVYRESTKEILNKVCG